MSFIVLSDTVFFITLHCLHGTWSSNYLHKIVKYVLFSLYFYLSRQFMTWWSWFSTVSMPSTLFSPLQPICPLLIHLFGSKRFNNYIFDNYAYVSPLQDLCQVQYLYLLIFNILPFSFLCLYILKDGKRPSTRVSFMKGSPFLKDLFVLILDKNFSLILTPPQKILFLGKTF